MNTYGNRKKKKGGILDIKIVAFILLLVVILISNAALKMYKRSKDTKEYLKAVEIQYLALEARYNASTEDLEYLKSETGMEREIRSKFDLAKEGEKAILIIEEEEIEIEEPVKRSFWGRLKNWVSS